LLGDGAAAVVVEWMPGESCILHSRLETWSEGANLAGLKGGGTLLPPDDPNVSTADHRFFMQGEQLLRATIPRLRQFLNQFFRESPVAQDDVRLVVPHQPSGPALQMLNRWGFEECRVVNMIARYGNCVAASLPMALAAAERDDRIQRGDPILLLGTAAGISLGAALVRW
jgi:3-oxoacyl-[acyl-carrier-protein] synthase-3